MQRSSPFIHVFVAKTGRCVVTHVGATRGAAGIRTDRRAHLLCSLEIFWPQPKKSLVSSEVECVG